MIKVEDGKGNVLAQKQIKNIPKLTREGIRTAMYETGKDLVGTARQLLKDPNKTGRLYKVNIGVTGRRLKRPRLHRASARGEAPARLSGTLGRSTDFFVRGTSELFFGSRADYAPFLELKEHLDRPYLRPSIEKNERNTIDHFERQVAKALRK